MERHFQEKITFETHSRKNLPHVAILKKFQDYFSKNLSTSPKNPKFWTFWEFFLFQSHSTANLLQFGEKIISSSDVNKIADVGVNAIGKHRVKKTSAHLRGRFCFHIFNMAQNNKSMLILCWILNVVDWFFLWTIPTWSSFDNVFARDSCIMRIQCPIDATFKSTWQLDNHLSGMSRFLCDETSKADDLRKMYRRFHSLKIHLPFLLAWKLIFRRLK